MVAENVAARNKRQIIKIEYQRGGVLMALASVACCRRNDVFRHVG